jgi:integrase
MTFDCTLIYRMSFETLTMQEAGREPSRQVSAVLALKWSDVDLDAGIAKSRAHDNKQKRDHVVQIGPVVPLPRRIKGDDARVFLWNHAKTHLADVYRKL